MFECQSARPMKTLRFTAERARASVEIKATFKQKESQANQC